MARARLPYVGLPVAAVATLLLAVGCAAGPEPTRDADLAANDPTSTSPTDAPEPTRHADRSPNRATRTPPSEERSSREATPPASRDDPKANSPGPQPSDGRPARAVISIPELELRGLLVVPYRGRTDDATGSRIQNAGDAASPHGPRGGVGPGGVGNYQVTGHRLTSTMPFRYLPRLRRGDVVHVDVRKTRYVYSIIGTRSTSFRSPESLREQRAAVPGQPGEQPRRAMITLSTCATIEDHAAGNYWSDQFDNPEHRIDKIGVLDRVLTL